MPRDTVRYRKSRQLPSLLARLLALGPRDKLRVCSVMSRLVNGETTAALIEQARRPYLACPECRNTAINRCGHANGLQRFRCKNCGRTFNSLTGTPLARLRLKPRWLAYLDCLRDPGCTVHNAANTVGVHASTSFRWRHRFLAWTKLDRPPCLQGVVEMTSTQLRPSHKGVRKSERRQYRPARSPTAPGKSIGQVQILLARDRGGKTIDFVVEQGELAAALNAQLRPRLVAGILLVTDHNRAYDEFARLAHIAHSTVKRGQRRRIDGVIQLHDATAYMGRFTEWLRHFNGVATHYLANYLGWRWAIDAERIDSAPRFLRVALGVFTS